jgi:galactokinase
MPKQNDALSNSYILQRHEEKFGRKPKVIATAPGRVNLIGEHTDYNDGYVFPMAIDRVVKVAVSRRNDRHLRFFSLDFDEEKQSDLDRLAFIKADGWANYLKGVISVLLSEGHPLCGLDMTVVGNVQIGSGLSSSAAVEVACGLSLQTLQDLKIEGEQLARLAQRAENEFVGVKCGIMDQFISRLGREGHAMLLDCRSLRYRQVPIEIKEACFLITNSNVPRGLLNSEYNLRRLACQNGLTTLKKSKPGNALRDFTPDDVRHNTELTESTKKKCLHVVEENQRVLDAESALLHKDYTAFGQRMNRSHESLRDLFQVSCPQLDFLVARACETPGVYGSRMTGAGFGGCTITLIKESAVASYQKNIEPYLKQFGIHAEVYKCLPSAGAMAEVID